MASSSRGDFEVVDINLLRDPTLVRDVFARGRAVVLPALAIDEMLRGNAESNFLQSCEQLRQEPDRVWLAKPTPLLLQDESRYRRRCTWIDESHSRAFQRILRDISRGEPPPTERLCEAQSRAGVWRNVESYGITLLHLRTLTRTQLTRAECNEIRRGLLGGDLTALRVEVLRASALPSLHAFLGQVGLGASTCAKLLTFPSFSAMLPVSWLIRAVYSAAIGVPSAPDNDGLDLEYCRLGVLGSAFHTRDQAARDVFTVLGAVVRHHWPGKISLP